MTDPRFGEQGGLLTYGAYLRLSDLLDQQVPESTPPAHDELLFITIHQVYELWFKLLLAELTDARDRMLAGESYLPRVRLGRARVVEDLLIKQVDVIDTMTPQDFLAFRTKLAPASGFQSAQFREIEYRLGLKDPSYLQHYSEGTGERGRLEAALAEPSLREAATAALERAGFDLGDRSTEALAAAWLQVYRDADRWFELYELAEKLVDIDDALAGWRHKHVLTVERIIGHKRGTGGSAGASYLRSTVDKRVFPELWALRTDL